MTTKNIDAPVLIAGGGLVGLSAAMFLAQHGVAATVIERLRGVSAVAAGGALSSSHPRNVPFCRNRG